MWITQAFKFFVQLRWLQLKAFCKRKTNLDSITLVFRESKGVETPKNSILGHFWKIIELNTDMLEPLLLSEINNWSLLFKMSPKPNWLYVLLKEGFLCKGVQEKKPHKIYLNIVTQRFLGSLITDLHSDLKKFKMADSIRRSTFIKINQI